MVEGTKSDFILYYLHQTLKFQGIIYYFAPSFQQVIPKSEVLIIRYY